MKTGDIVRFKNETEEEKNFVMRVLWIDSPRAMIELEIPGFSINPTQIVNVEDLELA